MAAGERAAAIGHFRDMLRLNPNDNQGLRHVLTSWLLATGDHGALEELLAAYDDDVFAEWAYAKTLLALRKGDEADERATLAAAWKRNPHVPALLTGATPISEHQDDHYTLGSTTTSIPVPSSPSLPELNERSHCCQCHTRLPPIVTIYELATALARISQTRLGICRVEPLSGGDGGDWVTLGRFGPELIV